jgi:uncharacterized protein (TIGR02597 family)
MRPFTSIAASLTVALCLTATLPAQTVSTIPVGFNTATLAAGSVGAPSTTVVSAPFYQVAKFQGANSAVGSNTLTFTGTTFSTGGSPTLPASNAPYLARIKSGPSTGRFFVVTSYNDTQLTLDTRGYTLVTGAPGSATQLQVAVGDSVEICPANTLNTLFPSGAPFITNSDNSQADNVYLWNGTGWDIYWYDPNAIGGAHWRKSPGIASFNANNTVILPDAAMFIKRRGASLNLTFLGTVPSTQEQSDIKGPASTFLSNRFPVNTTIGTLSFQTTVPGWVKNSDVNQADNIYLWNGSGWDVYWFDNNLNHWRKSPGIASFDAGTVSVPLGSGMFIVRRSTASGSGSTLVQALPYTL